MFTWKKAGTEWLRPKSRGKGLMISEFLTAAHGRLHYWKRSRDQPAVKLEACEIIKYGTGKGDEGWWTAEKMVNQVIEKAIPIFEMAFPHCIAVFAFDNSSGHACKAADALVARRMNLRPGGKQPVMHSTTMKDGQYQSMVFEPGDCLWETDIPISPHLIGCPKGMQRVMQERGIWEDDLRKQCGSEKKKDKGGAETEEERELRQIDQCEKGKTCCALRILENEDDFKNEKSLLEIEIVKRGHEVIFYPKFHCELNYIEYFWAEVKRYTRENCNYSFKELEETIRKGLDFPSLKTIRRFANRSMRWMEAYDQKLTKEQRDFAEKQYKSHRREYRRNLV